MRLFDIRLCVLTTILALSVHAQQQPITPGSQDEAAKPPLAETIPDGTPVKLRLLETVSSASAKVGEKVRLEVLTDTLTNGTLLIPKGTPVEGTVTTAIRRGMGRREGKVVFVVDKLRLADGSVTHLRSGNYSRGSGTGEPIFGPCTFPIPVVNPFRRGANIVIPDGTEFAALIQRGAAVAQTAQK